MKNKAVIGIVVILLLTVSFLLGVFVDDFTKPSKEKTLAMLFSYPDGSVCENPCLLGIQPGVTTIDQAKDLLDSHPFTKGGEHVVNEYSGRNYIDVPLQNNGIRIEVDYEKGYVLEVSLDGIFVRGLGEVGLKINEHIFIWEDIQSQLGAPETITASSGDGGMISEVVALYRTGWCVYADPANANTLMDFSILPDEAVDEIGINCYFFQNMK